MAPFHSYFLQTGLAVSSRHLSEGQVDSSSSLIYIDCLLITLNWWVCFVYSFLFVYINKLLAARPYTSHSSLSKSLSSLDKCWGSRGTNWFSRLLQLHFSVIFAPVISFASCLLDSHTKLFIKTKQRHVLPLSSISIVSPIPLLSSHFAICRFADLAGPPLPVRQLCNLSARLAAPSALSEGLGINRSREAEGSLPIQHPPGP